MNLVQRLQLWLCIAPTPLNTCNRPGMIALFSSQAITIIGGSDGAAPAQMKAYTNREDLDFSTVAELPPVQQWDLQENLNGQIEYPTQYESSAHHRTCLGYIIHLTSAHKLNSRSACSDGLHAGTVRYVEM